MRGRDYEDIMLGNIEKMKEEQAETLVEIEKRVIKGTSVRLVDHPLFMEFCKRFKVESRNKALTDPIVLKCFSLWLIENRAHEVKRPRGILFLGNC